MSNLFFVVALVVTFFQAGTKSPSLWQSYKQEANEKFGYPLDQPILVVKISEQKLYFLAASGEKSYAISSSKYGIGSEAGSNKTPLGYHKVKYKFGDNAAKGAIFKARKATGEIAHIYTDNTDVEEDYVTTRIMWLDGLETGKNSGKGISSFNRFIYIHGSPEEGLIGKPASHGCIRMKNDDVIELYNIVREGNLVLILP